MVVERIGRQRRRAGCADDLASARDRDPAAASRGRLARGHTLSPTAPAPQHRAACTRPGRYRSRPSVHAPPDGRAVRALHPRDPRALPDAARQPPVSHGARARLSRCARSLPCHRRTLSAARGRRGVLAAAHLAGRTGTDRPHFGKLLVGRARRPLMAFVMVLSYSRHLFVRFYLSATMASFLDAHVQAFSFFNAVPRTLLYDNLRSAVLERVHDAIRFHPTLLELAAWYHFQPRPVAVARGNEKGRVERAIRFVRDRFFAARRFADMADLNAQALEWCAGEAAERPCPEDRTRSVRACFEEEQPRLLALPSEPFPCQEHLIVRAGKTPYVRFDLNDYSIPHTHVRRSLQLLATLDTVRILDANTLIAVHARSFDRGAQIEDLAHIQALVEHKRAGRAHRAIDRLHHATPSAGVFFKLAAERGAHLGSLTRGLIDLLDTHGAAALEAALTAALAEDAAHLVRIPAIVNGDSTRW